VPRRGRTRRSASDPLDGSDACACARISRSWIERELDAELVLEAAHVAADLRLRDAEAQRRAPEMQLLGGVTNERSR
jgi:hypothetical protein